MRVVFGQLVLLSSLLLIFRRGAVIRVKVDEHTAGLEDPVPLPIGLFDMRQRPCQIPCHQHVEALRLEVRVFCVHDPERGVQPQNGSHMLGVLDHVRRQVDAGRLVPLGGKQAGEEAGTRADVQDPERPPLRQIPEKLREPARPLLAVEFTQSLRFKGLRPVRPVVSYAMLDQFHMLPLSAAAGGPCALTRLPVQ